MTATTIILVKEVDGAGVRIEREVESVPERLQIPPEREPGRRATQGRRQAVHAPDDAFEVLRSAPVHHIEIERQPGGSVRRRA